MKKNYTAWFSLIGLVKTKHLVVALFLSVIFYGNMQAQLSSKYTFSYNGTTTYASIAGTTLQSAAAGVSVDAVFTSIPIGFSFSFNCQTYTTCGISNNGFIWFGTGTVSATQYTPLSSQTGESGAVDGIISVYGCNITGTSATAALRYQTTGSAPNRVFTVEWKSVLNGGVERCDHEIKLTETSNRVDLIGFDNSYLVSGTANGQRGMRANTLTDFVNRKTSGGSLCATLAGTVNTDVCQILATSACGYMTSASSQEIDHIYSFTGSCCAPPTTGATTFNYSNVVVNGASSTADFTFTRGTGDGGVIAIAKAGSAPGSPSNGIVYTGANTAYGSGTAIGGGFLVYAGTGSGSGTVNVSLSSLTNGATYFISVYEYNATANCYISSALSGNIPIPVCSPPSTQASGNSISNIQTTQADINWTGNGNGNDVIVFFKQGSAISTDPTQTTNYNANAGFGLGDQIGATGARAVYKGTGSSVTVTGLTTNITYFYAIYAHNSTTNCYAVPAVIGSFTTTNSPMTTTAQVVTQASTATITPGSANNQILQLRIDCSTGTAPAFVLSQLFISTFATNGGTTNAADIANAKVYSTGTSSTFSTATQFGSTITNPGGTFVVAGSTTLVPGSNYFWLTYDITSSPTIGDFVDADLKIIDLGPIITPSGDPAGNRQITLVYCTPSPAFGGSACSAAGNVYITTAKLSGTTFYSGGTCGANPYTNLSGSVIANAITGNPYTLNLISADATAVYDEDYYAWVDLNNNGLFTDPGENILAVTLAPGASQSVTGTPFTPASAGSFRMRVAVMSGGFGSIPAISPCAGQSLYYGEFKDFTLSVSASSSPMTYTSSTTVQNTAPVPPNNTNQQIVSVRVVTTGTLSSIALSSLTFNTNGSTNITGDATNARVFYTGTNGTFATTTQFGSTINNPSGSYTLTGSQTLSAGTNYFWVAYDVPATATLGDVLDAECTSITVASTTYTPSITAPAGSRPISLVYCVPSGGATGCSFSGDAVITAVSLNGTGSTFNFTGGTCLTPYPNNYQINPYTGNVNQGGTYTTTMVKSGSSFGARFIAWVDWNNDADFTDAGEKIMDVTQSAASATGSSFSVPGAASAGAHRMRTWIGYTGSIVPSDIPTVTTGCEVLNGFSNQGEIRDFTVNVVIACTAPSFSVCPGTTTATTSSGICTAAVSYSTSLTGTSPSVTYSFSGATNSGSISGNGSGSVFNIGTTFVTLTATNGCGTNTCNFNVVVTDNQAPIANLTNLPNVTGECSAASVSTPTATDNCLGSINGTTTDPTSYSAQGTYTIHWTYSDGNGNSSTQNQTVTVHDDIAPVPNITILPIVSGECSASATIPTATDNCAGSVSATTTDATSYSSQGTYIIHWTYSDGNGNSTTQNQTVIVDDNTAPVADAASLPDITGQCSASVIASPTATDNCTGSITGTTTDPTSYNTQGTYTIQWLFNDGNGNSITQDQTVIVQDVTPPTITAPADISVCNGTSFSLGTATGSDNCGSVTFSNDVTGPFTIGTTVVTWTADDGNGNITTATQNVEIRTVPTAGSIAGPAVVCLITNTTYSVSAPTATGYVWTVPTGITINSGQGTNSINVIIAAGTVLGDITVTPSNSCGAGATVSLSITKKPGIPGPISGLTSVCGLTSTTYSIAPVFNATSYAWTLPSGMTIVGPATGPSITVNILSTYAFGLVKVSAVNACGNVPGTSLTVYGTPAVPVTLTGPDNVCGMSTATYTCSAVTGATSYTWGLPAGMSFIGSATGTSITASVNANNITGIVKVRANSPCASSTYKQMTLINTATAPGGISGPTMICGLITATYSIAAVPDAVSYVWTLSPGITGTSTSTNITVTIASSTTSGTVKVATVNACGNVSTQTLLNVSKVVTPGTITGDATPCTSSVSSYCINRQAGVTYLWQAVGGTVGAQVLTSTTSCVNVTWNATAGSGTVKVQGTNACGTSPDRTLAVTKSVCPGPISVNNSASASVAPLFNLYPNPTSSDFTMDITSDISKEIIVEVIDILGNIIVSEKHSVSSGTTSISTSVKQFKAGMYFVRVMDVNNAILYTQRVVRE